MIKIRFVKYIFFSAIVLGLGYIAHLDIQNKSNPKQWRAIATHSDRLSPPPLSQEVRNKVDSDMSKILKNVGDINTSKNKLFEEAQKQNQEDSNNDDDIKSLKESVKKNKDKLKAKIITLKLYLNKIKDHELHFSGVYNRLEDIILSTFGSEERKNIENKIAEEIEKEEEEEEKKEKDDNVTKDEANGQDKGEEYANAVENCIREENYKEIMELLDRYKNMFTKVEDIAKKLKPKRSKVTFHDSHVKERDHIMSIFNTRSNSYFNDLLFPSYEKSIFSDLGLSFFLPQRSDNDLEMMMMSKFSNQRNSGIHYAPVFNIQQPRSFYPERSSFYGDMGHSYYSARSPYYGDMRHSYYPPAHYSPHSYSPHNHWAMNDFTYNGPNYGVWNDWNHSMISPYGSSRYRVPSYGRGLVSPETIIPY